MMSRPLAFVVLATHLTLPSRLISDTPYELHKLPPFHVTGMAESRDGTLWLAARNGLFRFDGFNLQDMTPPPAKWANDVDITEDGSVWVATPNGLYRYRDSRFEIVWPADTWQVATLGNVLAFRSRGGTWRRTAAGKIEPLPKCSIEHYYASILVDAQNRFQLVCGTGVGPAEYMAQIPPGDESTSVRTRLPPGDWIRALTDRQGTTWLESTQREFYRFLPSFPKPLKHPTPPYLELFQYRLLSARDGGAWLLGTPTVHLTDNFYLDRGRGELNRVTHLSDGIRQNLWVAQVGVGLLNYQPLLRRNRWSAASLGNKNWAPATHAGANNSLLFGAAGMLRLDKERNRWSSFGAAGHIRNLLPLKEGGYVALLNGQIGILDSNGIQVQLIETANEWEGQSFDAAGQDRSGRIWILGKTILELRRQRGKWHLFESPRDFPGDDLGALDFQLDASGKPYISLREGIASYSGKGWELIRTDRPIGGISAMEINNGEIWALPRGKVDMIRLSAQGKRWSVEHFKAPGSSSLDPTIWLRFDSRGWLWLASSTGIRVSNGRDFANWIHLHEGNGFDIGRPHFRGFQEDHDGSIWMSGDRGVMKVVAEPRWFHSPLGAPPPRITVLETDKNHVRALVGGLQAPLLREFPFEYRLVPHFNDWRKAKGGALDFNDLPDGEYRLELRYAGTGASPIAQSSVRIGPPPMQTNWLPVLCFGAVAILLAYAMRKHDLWMRATYHLEKKIFNWREQRAPSPLGLALEQGDRFAGKYEILGQISSGGFSKVYQAIDLSSGLSVALKLIERGDHDESWLRSRFSHEQNALRSLEHPNIVRWLDGGVAVDGAFFLVMPFLSGPSLRQVMESGKLTSGEITHLLRRLASGIDYAHSRGIVHLDIKPENIILSPDGPQLIDFGSSGLQGPPNRLALTKVLTGSTLYMAPERLTGHYGEASDVYSFAAITQEILAGKPLNEFASAFFEPSFLEELTALLRLRLGLSANTLALLIVNALSVNPAHRPKPLMSWVERIAEELIDTPRPGS